MVKNPGESEVLIPYTDFEANDLARQLNGLVKANTEILTLRGIRGVTERYGGSLEKAIENVQNGQAGQEKLGHFAIVNAAGDVRGLGSVYPNLTLKEQHLPLPPFFARGPLSTIFPTGGPNVHAWTANDDLPLLTDAYRGLIYRAAAWWRIPSVPRVWTVEPIKAPSAIHQAITDSGLQAIKSGRFDDEESKGHIPPKSTLYVRSNNGRLL